MGKVHQAIRGMKDLLPNELSYWQRVEACLQQVVRAYGYQEIRMPIVESTGLFARSIGEVTDIVEKEMYTFLDRNQDSLTLRPEGTAGCVRAGIEHGLLHNQQQRLWYQGPMFRHERPQKGRYRQFYQLGVEAFGMTGPDIDAELILMSARFWRELGLESLITLQLNTLGSAQTRQHYRQVLVDYFNQYSKQLDEDSQRRLQTNPLRILDSKNPDMQAIISDAPSLLDHLDDSAQAHFTELRHVLDAAGLAYTINPRLVRGLDYYDYTVFEWVTDALGAQGTVCAGGRYNGLVELLGGSSTPAAGFALGLERLVLLYQDHCDAEENFNSVDVYLIALGESATQHSFLLMEKIHDAMPQLKLIHHCGGGKLKKQFKRADQSGARLALVLGEEEVASGEVGVKFLREDREQQQVALSDLPVWLQQQFNE